MTRNYLGRETSPYLLQHRDNPVHWRAWGAEAFAVAQAENKPILLSVGYAACHWCHVMAHESFENDEIAALMNEKFVNIKVDREERPDLDTIYQSALGMLGEHGGWPLTMFLTPGGDPFWGGTYFPPSPRFGRLGFADVLSQIHRLWREAPDKVASNVTALRDGLDKFYRAKPGTLDALGPDSAGRLARDIVREIDPVSGGLQGAPKFPQCGLFEALWRGWLRSGAADMKKAVLVTCDGMCQGGIYDHLGGGFARYSTDAEWLAPHFEKMLYDNAQLIDLLALVWQGTGAPLYETRLRETVAWVLREMITEGAFAASLDADSEGAEGTYYVWSEAEIDALLGASAAAFKQAYDVSAGGNWEGHNILNRLRAPVLDDGAETELAESRAILLAAREPRERPAWDDKVLADWNGLMIAALANAGAVFGEADWLAAATRAFAFVRDNMTDEGRLLHGWRSGRARHAAMLDDYANMTRAALALFETTGEASYRDQAEDWVALLDRHYWDEEDGGYFFTADDAEQLIVRAKTATDNATPNGNAVMIGVLAHLYHVTGEADYRDRAQATAEAFAGQAKASPLAMATYHNALETLTDGLQVVIVGAPDAPDTNALLAIIHKASLPGRVLTVIAPDATLPPNHPAHGKGQTDAKATAYLCRGPTCSLPVTEPDDLRAALPERAVG
jgi:uncharacterized protein YyaL (SSP411 family)